ncbi:MAG: hypothetical protein ACRCW1_06345, partial [Anaerotignaceae bacterium]
QIKVLSTFSKVVGYGAKPQGLRVRSTNKSFVHFFKSGGVWGKAQGLRVRSTVKSLSAFSKVVGYGAKPHHSMIV